MPFIMARFFGVGVGPTDFSFAGERRCHWVRFVAGKTEI
jgi:hypothetical protein